MTFPTPTEAFRLTTAFGFAVLAGLALIGAL